MDADQVPKYLNSPETADLLERPDALRTEPDEGRHPEAGIRGAGRRLFRFRPGVSVRRRAGRGLLRHRPDARSRHNCCGGSRRRSSSASTPTPPDRGRPRKSCELLVKEGFEVNVVVLDKGEDPDTFIRQQGGDQYRAQAATLAAVS